MLKGVHRPKRPELVKALLLEAGAELLVSGAQLSIGAVADLAGVTKGAVQHHFPTREALVLALYEHLAEEFQAAVADDGTGASAAWRYARPVLDPPSGESSDHGKALLAACVIERGVTSRWAEWVRKDRAQDGQDTNKLLARLAADGLWLSDVLGVYDLSPTEREALAQAIHRLAEGA
ncbi:TetR/AcrR family transcriptional regulator [Variovorax saccharolyticus]|uniref:TetR/AcrR family transcriptional regulator n=1 Tax=Variovorax saccharolyticus TaxID=3053516 RepID=UPI002576275D|nr:TetR/AcrR family transcriptional regulator [Variovorax sp. J31P216]MDM0026555.1 TetR/AcrR family transcriptional regulator [Variovorax sp. J31P216]